MDAELRDRSTGEWLHYDVMDRDSLDVTNASDVIVRILQAMFAVQRKNYSKVTFKIFMPLTLTDFTMNTFWGCTET